MLNLFATPILIKTLTLNVQEIEQYCYAVQKTSFGRTISNRNGWQSLPLQINNSLHSFYNELLHTLNEYKEQVDAKGTVVLGDVWININKKGSSNIPHLHNNSFMSGVYYVKTVKDCGNLYFQNANPVNYDWQSYHFNNSKCNLYCNDTWDITPNTNDIIIFPSWAKHGVHSNITNADRISISFNASLA